MNIKKIIALILSLVMILPSFVFAAGSDSFDISINGDEMRLLSDLGIISSDFTHDSLITRGELADVLRAMMNYSSSASVLEQPFDDVLTTHEYASSIALVSQIGLMTGDGNGSFRPDDHVSMPEALTVLIKLLGYEMEAKVKGGYPTGYVTVAIEHDIANGGLALSGEPLGRDVFYKLVYNTLLTEVNERTSYGNNDSYSFRPGDLLISQHFGIYVDEGVLTANGIKNINSEISLKNDEIAIDGAIYKINSAMPDKVGYGMRVFYKESKYDRIVVSYQEMENEVINLSPEGLGFDPLSLTYTYSSSNKLQKYTLDNNAKVLYNNSVLRSNMLSLALPSNGSVTLINNDNDNGIDVVIIENYVNIVVDYYSAYKDTLYERSDVYGSGSRIYEYNKYDKIYAYDELGREVDPTALKKDTVISVMTNQKNDILYLNVSTSTVSGAVSSLKQELNAEIEVKGMWYSFASDVKYDISTIDIGAEYTFYLDCKGKIVYALKSVNDAKHGYVLRAGNAESGLSERYIIEMLLSDSKVTQYRLAKKINVTYFDGSAVRNERMTAAELIAQLETNGAFYSANPNRIRQIILFDSVSPSYYKDTKDSGYYNGETNNIINSVTLPMVAASSADAENNSSYPLIRHLHYINEWGAIPESNKTSYVSSVKSIGQKVVFNDNATMFRVPVLSVDVSGVNSKQMGVGNVASMSNGTSLYLYASPNGRYGEFDAYTMGGNKMENDILVRYVVTAGVSRNSIIDDDANTYLVAKIRNVVNEDGEPVYKLTLAGQYRTSEYYIDEPEMLTADYLKEQKHGYDGTDTSGKEAVLHPNKTMLQEGDIVRIATSSNIITAIHLMYDYTNDHITYSNYLKWGDYSRLITGDLTDKGETTAVEYLMCNGNTERICVPRVAVYDVKEREVVYGTVADCDIGDKMAASDRWGALKEFFVYKVRPGR